MSIIDKIKQLNIIQDLAFAKNGKCLEDVYINAKTKMKFRCSNDHIFTTTAKIIKAGFWCKICSGNSKFTIEKINEIIKSKNIICKSKIYHDNKSPLIWECQICKFSFIKSKNGLDREFIRCKNCFYISQFEKAKKIVESYNGLLLSDKYIHSNLKIKCKCSYGHIFDIKYASLVNIGRWCSICAKDIYLSESICRSYFEQMFGEQFPSVRPDFLKKENGYNLELDGYCAKLNIAFEHQGTFHYEKMYNRLEETLNNDKIKKEMCKKLGINLIIIPQLFNKTPLNSLKKLILEESKLLKIIVPFPDANININNLYAQNKLNYFSDLATSKQGKLISKIYEGACQKLIWECKFGHQWQQAPYAIKRGHWCPVCVGQKQSKNIIKG